MPNIHAVLLPGQPVPDRVYVKQKLTVFDANTEVMKGWLKQEFVLGTLAFVPHGSYYQLFADSSKVTADLGL
jgi:hypothetical protein